MNGDLKKLTAQLAKEQKIKKLIVTRGTDGAIMYDTIKNSFFYTAAYSDKSLDKVGSGDAMLAILSLCLKDKLDQDLESYQPIITDVNSSVRSLKKEVTDFKEIPVVSSKVSVKEVPSTKSIKLAIPLVSAITGRVYGSHSAIFLPLSTISPSLKNNFEP